jgi:hypothetical protein
MLHKGIKYTIGGKELTLVLNVAALAEICDAYGSIDEMSKAADAGTSSQIRIVPNVIAILANQGAALSGANEQITPAWIMAHAFPSDIASMTQALTDTINTGLKTEIKEPEGDVDDALDEIRKNAQGAAGS